MRHNWQLAVLLALAFGLIVYGLFRWSEVAGFVGAGVLLTVWSLLFVWELPAGEQLDSGGGDDE